MEYLYQNKRLSYNELFSTIVEIILPLYAILSTISLMIPTIVEIILPLYALIFCKYSIFSVFQQDIRIQC